MLPYNRILYLIKQNLETNSMDQSNTEKFHFFHLLPSLAGGGAERVILTYHRALLKRNYKSTILLLRNKIDYDIEDIRDSVIVLSKKDHITYIKQLDEFILAKRIEKIATQSSDKPIIIASLEASYNVAQHIKKFDVIYMIHNALQSKIDKWRTKDPKKAQRHLENFNKIFTGKNILAVSQGVLKDLTGEMGIKPNKSAVLYNPVDVEEIRNLAEEYKPNIEGKYIVHPARFHEQKRHDILLKAFELVKSPVKLVLLADVKEELRQMIDKHPKKELIITPGFQKNPYPWIKNAALTVLSSDREGFGVVLVESLVCGTPVVSSNCKSGPSEILTGELSKYLAEVNNPVSLADKIDLALKEYPIIEEKYYTEYKIENILNRLLHISA